MEGELESYAVEIDLVGQLEKSAEKALGYLEKNYGICYLKNHAIAPHIALLYGEFSEKELLIEQIKKEVSKTELFSITGLGLGMYVLDHPVIYIRIKKSAKLMDLQARLFGATYGLDCEINQFYCPDTWESKASLAVKDTNLSDIGTVLTELKELDFKSSFKLDKLKLVSFDDSNVEKTEEVFTIK